MTEHNSSHPSHSKPQTGGKSKKMSKKNMSKKTMTKKSKMPEGMAWCMTCEKRVKMVDPKKVPMKKKGGKMGERYSAKDEAGHKVSRII